MTIPVAIAITVTITVAVILAVAHAVAIIITYFEITYETSCVFSLKFGSYVNYIRFCVCHLMVNDIIKNLSRLLIG